MREHFRVGHIGSRVVILAHDTNEKYAFYTAPLGGAVVQNRTNIAVDCLTLSRGAQRENILQCVRLFFKNKLCWFRAEFF